MGRIRTMLVKRTGSTYLKEYPEIFTGDFKNNKIKLGEVAEIHTTKLRNIIAGYITKLVTEKTKKQNKKPVIKQDGHDKWQKEQHQTQM